MKRFFLFIILLRALAAIIITNSHYTGVYPTDLIANGGLLGDVLFFAVSGFCLANTTGNFGKWYFKRLIRIYIPVWIISLVYLAIGAYTISSITDAVETFVHPTHWHFIASITILYIPMFIVSKYVRMDTKNWLILAICILAIQLGFYYSLYDISHYHIDNVREPMIEFLFFQAMLLGMHFRWKANYCEDDGDGAKRKMVIRISIGIVLCILYFASKISFVKIDSISSWQICNQIILFALLFVLFDIAMHSEMRLHNIENTKIWRCVSFISERTLEIYLVQYVILEYCKVGPFPINWIILTVTILVTAVLLRRISQLIIKRIIL